jgi:hypothetical protein
MTKRPYSKPSLDRRDPLAAVTAQLVKTSPFVVDN